MRSLKNDKSEKCRHEFLACQVPSGDRPTRERRTGIGSERLKVTARHNVVASNHAGAQCKIRAGTSFSAGGPSFAAVASDGGSNDEPALCQTPATRLTIRPVDRESAASSKPTPVKSSSRPLAESGGAALQNAESSSLHGKGSLAGDAWFQSGLLASTSDSDHSDEPGNHRSSHDTIARHRTKDRATPPRVQGGWCGSEGNSGRATSVRRLPPQFSIYETESFQNSGSLQVYPKRGSVIWSIERDSSNTNAPIE